MDSFIVVAKNWRPRLCQQVLFVNKSSCVTRLNPRCHIPILLLWSFLLLTFHVDSEFDIVFWLSGTFCFHVKVKSIEVHGNCSVSADKGYYPKGVLLSWIWNFWNWNWKSLRQAFGLPQKQCFSYIFCSGQRKPHIERRKRTRSFQNAKVWILRHTKKRCRLCLKIVTHCEIKRKEATCKVY